VGVTGITERRGKEGCQKWGYKKKKDRRRRVGKKRCSQPRKWNYGLAGGDKARIISSCQMLLLNWGRGKGRERPFIAWAAHPAGFT